MRVHCGRRIFRFAKFLGLIRLNNPDAQACYNLYRVQNNLIWVEDINFSGLANDRHTSTNRLRKFPTWSSKVSILD